MLHMVCMRYARDEAMAKDVLQETFIRIFRSINKYQPTGSFEAWMRQIAVRRSLQWLEKSCFKHEMHPLEMPDKKGGEPSVYLKYDLENIQSYVEGLPTGFRTVFKLSILEGYSHIEIADILDISESTSRSQLARARKMLREKLIHQKKTSHHEVEMVR